MSIETLVTEAFSVASEFGLRYKIIDMTENTANLRLYIDNELFIHVYMNQKKSKVNLHLVFKGRRFYGADAEGGKYHVHPFDDPESHIFTEEKKGLRNFILESLDFLSKEGAL